MKIKPFHQDDNLYQPVCMKVSVYTEPLFKLLTNTSAKPFPLSVSITAASEAECKIPALSKFAWLIIDLIVNDISKSKEFDIHLITSPVWNGSPWDKSSIANSITEVVPCWNVDADATTAVAPEVWPVITWLTVSWPEPEPLLKL